MAAGDHFISPDFHGPGYVAFRSHHTGRAWLMPVPAGATLGSFNSGIADWLGTASTKTEADALAAKHTALVAPQSVPPQAPLVLA